MKIGLVLPSLHAGGAEHVARQWIRHTTETFGDEWIAYLYGNPAPQGVLGDLKCEIRQFEQRGRSQRAATLPIWLRKQVSRDGIDACLSMLTYSNIATLVALKAPPSSPTPVIISERNVPSSYMPLEGTSGRLQLALAKRLYGKADAALAISHATAADLLNFGLDASQMRVLPNPAAVVTRQDQGSTTRSPRRQPASLTVLFVGRFVPQKRPHLFIETLAELNRRGVVAKGLAVGSGPLEGSVKTLARTLSVDVDFLGWVEDWTEYARISDVFLLPSSVEGFGNVLVEAATLGLPSVALSQALGVADAIVPGITGELAFDSQPSSLADAVVRASTLELDPPSLSPWLERFSPSASAARLHQMLSDVVTGDLK